MTGELCSQPPLGVAETMLPKRSTTSTWQVSPRAVGSRRLADAGLGRRAQGGRGSRGSRPPGAARPQLARRLGADEPAPLVRVPGAEQIVERHVAVAVPGLAVGEGELGALDDRVDEVRRPRGRVEVEAFEQRELLQETGPWPHGPVL